MAQGNLQTCLIQIRSRLSRAVVLVKESWMPDLSTKYLGLTLKNPLVVSSTPLSDSVDSMIRLEQAGAAAIVMSSIFEELLPEEARVAQSGQSSPPLLRTNIDSQGHLDLLKEAKSKLKIPVIFSMNGSGAGEWTNWARLAQEAGADALELNYYLIPAELQESGVQVEERCLSFLKSVKEKVTIPVAVKLNPYFSSTANICLRLVEAGADGLVLFNRFYQPDLDIEKKEVVPRISLSNSGELRLSLRWVAILYGRLQTSLAVTAGVHTCSDVVKSLMVGADVAMMASEILRYGPQRITVILRELRTWMEEHGQNSIAEMRGSMSSIYADGSSSFERTIYMQMLQSWYPPLPGMI